jgi:hypothetical protein
VAGVATFSGVSIDLDGTGYVLGASSGSLTADTSATFDITPTPAGLLATGLGDRLSPPVSTFLAPLRGVSVPTRSLLIAN